MNCIKELTFKPGNASEEDHDRLKNHYLQNLSKSSWEIVVVKIADRLCNTLDFCASGDPWAVEYLNLGAPLFKRIDECKGSDRIRATLDADATLRAKIRAQAVAAYPVQALIAGIDTFTWDNLKVDAEGNLWFVDNGASFDFRACGKLKGWFWQRHDVADPRSGYLSLAKHPNQYYLRSILGKVDDAELWAAAKNCRFAQLVAQLPDSHRKAELTAYATALEAAARKI